MTSTIRIRWTTSVLNFITILRYPVVISLSPKIVWHFLACRTISFDRHRVFTYPLTVSPFVNSISVPSFGILNINTSVLTVYSLSLATPTHTFSSVSVVVPSFLIIFLFLVYKWHYKVVEVYTSSLNNCYKGWTSVETDPLTIWCAVGSVGSWALPINDHQGCNGDLVEGSKTVVGPRAL